MRISELSGVTHVPIPTIKYYLREGLLMPGDPRGPNRAEYDDSHVHRIRLIRALVDVGGLGIASVRAVLEAVGDETLPVHEMLGVAHYALDPPPDAGPVPDEVVEAREEVDRFLADLGWSVSRHAPSRRKLADAVVALRRLGRDADAKTLLPYARAAEKLAARELSRMPAGASRADLVEQAVVGTVLFEAVLVSLRKLAQEHHSASRFGSRG